MTENSLWWEHQRYSHIKIPKALFRNEKYEFLSTEAKLLYGFLLDRIGLSAKSGKRWQNENGEYFVIYPMTEIMERFHCGQAKATKLMKELVDAGLVFRKLKGYGHPYRIMVLPFEAEGEKKESGCRENNESVSAKIGGIESFKTAPNKPYRNKKEYNKPYTTSSAEDWAVVEEDIKENICFDILITEYPEEQIQGIVNLMCDTICSGSGTIRVGGEPKPREIVKRKLLSLNEMHIRFVFDELNTESKNIHYIKNYLLARLYEAPDIMDSYYQARVAHDCVCAPASSV